MRKIFVFAAVLALAAMATAPAFADTVYSDNFANLDNWTNVKTTLVTFDGTVSATADGTGSAKFSSTVCRAYHNLGSNLSGNFVATWSIFDDSMTRLYGEIDSRSDGTYGGTLNQLFAAGKYSSVTMVGEAYDGNYYQGRIVTGTNTGWFNLNAAGAPTRSAGWHKFSIERTNDGTMNFFVDGILGRSFTGAAAADMNVLALGLGAGTETNNGWVDNVSVTTAAVPEPSSLLAMLTGVAGLAGVIRRKLA